MATPALRVLVKESPEKFEQAFINATEHEDFVRAVETTTKSTSATRTRFEVFYKKIKEVYDFELEIPKILDLA